MHVASEVREKKFFHQKVVKLIREKVLSFYASNVRGFDELLIRFFRKKRKNDIRIRILPGRKKSHNFELCNHVCCLSSSTLAVIKLFSKRNNCHDHEKKKEKIIDSNNIVRTRICIGIRLHALLK